MILETNICCICICIILYLFTRNHILQIILFANYFANPDSNSKYNEDEIIKMPEFLVDIFCFQQPAIHSNKNTTTVLFTVRDIVSITFHTFHILNPYFENYLIQMLSC